MCHEDWYSNHESILRGVPTGSILGLLLFNLYTNGVFRERLHGYWWCMRMTHCWYILKAQWMSFCFDAARSISLKWMVHPKLFKYKYLLTNPIICFFTLNLKGKLIKGVKSCKCLSFVTDSEIKFGLHQEHVRKCIAPYVYMLYRLNTILSRHVFSKIYYAHIHSFLIYLNTIWSSDAAYKLNKP